jgi:secretion/DNA translocation related TadE-like protein
VTGERGSASLWVLGVGLAVLLFAGAVAAAGSVLVARHRAQAAADLGALAGAVRAGEGPDAACARARQIIEANGASLVECQVDGLDVVVGVEVAPAGVGRAIGPARARARAGPVPRSAGRPGERSVAITTRALRDRALVERIRIERAERPRMRRPPGRAMVRCPQGLWRRTDGVMV